MELARKLIAGEPEAFDRFVEHLRTKIFHYSWLMCGQNACLLKRRKRVFAPSQELSLDDFLPAMDHAGGHGRLQIADWSRLPDRQMLQSELKASARPEDAVKTRLHRARLAVRQMLDEYLRTDGRMPVLGTET